MKPARIILVCLVGVLIVLGVALATGSVPLLGGDDSARPPCEQLPSRQSVADAVASRQALVTRIEDVGSGVKVEVATPCQGQQDRAIVSVKYTTDAEREGVDAVLRQDGFGVALELVSQ